MLRVTIAATTEPVSVDQAKVLLRIDHAALDEILPTLISAAREVVERQTSYALAKATYEWTPVGERVAPLPIEPGVVKSENGAYPIVFETDPGPIPPALVLVIVMLVGSMVANPEASADKALSENPALQTMMFPFRRVLP